MPLHPGHFGGEIRDFHLLRYLLKISTVEFFSVKPLPTDATRRSELDWLMPFLQSCHTPHYRSQERRRSSPDASTFSGHTSSRSLGRVTTGTLQITSDSSGPSGAARCDKRSSVRSRTPSSSVRQVNPMALTFSLPDCGPAWSWPPRRRGRAYPSFGECIAGTDQVGLRPESRRARRFEEENLQL